jgi:predicted NAD/FAD-binding protein
VGAGVSGIAAAYRLQQEADVVLFEGQGRLGGHTDTHAVLVGGATHAVDSGFIVFNPDNYPRFSSWLDELGVESQPSDMSFGVSNQATGVEYGSRGLGALFCQRRNLVSPRFLRMLADLRRFYRDAVDYPLDESLTLGELLDRHGYGAGFVEDHIGPMCGALWSAAPDAALAIPARHVIAFMTHHRMLQLDGRPQWRVIKGGSSTYLQAFLARFRGEVRLSDPVQALARTASGVDITSASGTTRFDAVVLACHSDEALGLLADPSQAERDVLGAIGYQRNRVVVHSDDRVMPEHRAAWSSWNALVGAERPERCQVSYWMNLLQSLPGRENFFVTLNPQTPLKRVWSEREYAHPVFTRRARAAQRCKAEISGVRNTWYCGAYWGWGFHEDGFVSGMEVAEGMLGSMADAA